MQEARGTGHAMIGTHVRRSQWTTEPGYYRIVLLCGLQSQRPGKRQTTAFATLDASGSHMSRLWSPPSSLDWRSRRLIPGDVTGAVRRYYDHSTLLLPPIMVVFDFRPWHVRGPRQLGSLRRDGL